MAITANQVSSQVAGAIRALEKLPAKERESKPSATFADNYNNLLALAKEAMPEVHQRRWPPVAGILRPAMGQASCEVRFTEIHSFLEQVRSILDEGRVYF
jgi:hypothetical protein